MRLIPTTIDIILNCQRYFNQRIRGFVDFPWLKSNELTAILVIMLTSNLTQEIRGPSFWLTFWTTFIGLILR